MIQLKVLILFWLVDTDLLVLLIFHTQPQGKDIFFVPEPKKNSKACVWNIKETKEKLGPLLCKHILFIHAFLRCDTTSGIYGFGKSALMKKIKSDEQAEAEAEVFLSLQSSSAEIQKAGEQAMAILYNGKPDESLNGLRYKRYNEEVATNIVHVQPQVLPPTEAATKFHSFLVYYQIC